jgi:hypothetical protein
MVVILQFSLCLNELQRLLINVDDCIIPENVMLPLVAGLYNVIHLFVIDWVLTDDI